MKKLFTILLMTISLLTLTGCKDPIIEGTPIIEQVKAELIIDDELGEVTLPTLIDGVTITWQSSKPNLITSDGVITMPLTDTTTSLTAILSYDDRVMTKIFDVVILGEFSVDYFLVLTAADGITFDSYELTGNLTLLNQTGDVIITWSSSDDAHLDSDGIVTRAEADTGNVIVTLTATLTYNEIIIERDFVFTIMDLSQTVVYDGYYMGATGLTGDLLKAFLHDLIDSHTVISYSSASSALKQTDLDPNNSNNIILLYSGASIDKDHRCSTSCPNDSWNREHVWPQSTGNFGTGDAPGSDIHALRPTYVPINSTRGSLDFDNDDGSGVEIYFGGIATGSFVDSNSFEPRDEVKGDVARMIFYMAVRYEGDDGYTDLEIDDIVGNGAPTIGVLTVLLEWHLNDLPDAFEINRNEVIFGIQHNRNPFIDHPEFAMLIWGTN